MALDPRWEEVFGPYEPISSFFKVWTLELDHARAFQRHWNAHVDVTQPKRYVEDIDHGDLYGIGLAMGDLVRALRGGSANVSLLLLREAVELLHVLAHVDFALWRHVFHAAFSLKDRWRDHIVPVWLFLPYDPFARRNGVAVTKADVTYFLETLGHTPRSTTYFNSLAIMWSILEIPQKRHSFPPVLEIILHLAPPSPTFIPQEHLGSHLRTMTRVLHQISMKTPNALRVPIHVIATNVGLSKMMVDTECLADLVALSTSTNIRSLSINLQRADKDGVSPWILFGQLLQNVVGDRAPVDPARHVSVHLANGDFGRFTAVCSSIRVSGCVESFFVNAQNQVCWSRPLWLRWLAWSWLDNGRNEVDLDASLTIDTLTTDDVAVLNDVVRGGNPHSRSGSLRWIMTTSSVVVRSMENHVQETLTVCEGTRLAVVDESSEDDRVRVVVAGYGIASMDLEELTTKTISIESSHPHTRIKKFSLIVTEENLASVAGATSLVLLLGARLMELQLVVEMHEFDQDHIACILRLCPRLQKVKVKGVKLADLDLIVVLCNGQESELTELSFISLRLTQALGLNAFLAALSSPTHRMAKQLKRVGLGFTNDSTVDPSAVDGVLNMLQQNRRLKWLEVEFPASLQPTGLYPYVPAVSIPRPGTMLSLLQKLTFLHVLQTIGSISTTRLVHDHNALTNVFEFAAEQTTRTASVSFSH